MLGKNIFMCLLVLVAIVVPSYADKSISTYKVVFTGFINKITQNPKKLDSLAGEWGATGISLQVYWGEVDTDLIPGCDSWTAMDNAITKILTCNIKPLDVYIRVNMGFHKNPPWTKPPSQYLNNDADYQIKQDGKIFSIYDPSGTSYPLNFTSETSRQYMISFYTAVIDHVKEKFASQINRFKEISATWSVEGECEYPHGPMCGYATPEIIAFRNFLIQKYATITELNVKWNASFTSFDQINPRNYNWNFLLPFGDYTYSNGRVDWMSFRTNELKMFLNDCAAIAHSKGIKSGIQFGSIYDNLIEYRGWFDPTICLEKADAVHVADIYQYNANFGFAADYLRSLCDFWTSTNNLFDIPVKFSTETNWPGYNGQPANILEDYWIQQLVTYYNKGASEHYIACWDNFSLAIYSDSFAEWKDTLEAYSGRTLQIVANQHAVHMGCEKVLVDHNPKNENDGRFELYRSIIAEEPYLANEHINYDGAKDIVTNKMIEKNSNYLCEYLTLYFTKASEWINTISYLNLMKSSVTSNLRNATWFSDNGHGEYAYTHGLKNEYNEIISPIHLIWRTRPDLMTIWPDANLPAQGSGYTDDFVAWAYKYGCGYAGPNNREYPYWEIRDNGNTGNYKYDNNIRKVWNRRPDLQTAFPDAHYHDPMVTSIPNMISWAKQWGYFEEPELIGYNHWPYIGDCVGIPPKSSEMTSPHIVIPNNCTFNVRGNIINGRYAKATFDYSFYETSCIKLTIYNSIGQQIANLVNTKLPAGMYCVTWNIENTGESSLPCGEYYYHFIATSIYNGISYCKSGKIVVCK